MNKQQAFLVLMVVLSGVMSLMIFMPFFQYIMLAVILAYLLYPVNRRVEPHLGRRWAPVAVMTGAIIALIVPVAYIMMVLFRSLQAFSRGNTELKIGDVEQEIRTVTGREVDLGDPIVTLGEQLSGVLFGNVSEVVSVGTEVSIGLALTVFLVYYLLRDGERFVEWVIEIIPMSSAVCDRVFRRLDRTAWGVIVGHLFVAFAQGVIGGIGLFFAGIPRVIFWSFVMIVFSLLPLIGAFVVWAPGALYLVAIDQFWSGVFLFVYGALVVSMVDNYARPIVIDREAHLNPGVILVGVFGGVFALGMTGLFIGPIMIVMFVVMLTAFDEEYDSLAERAEVEDEEPETTAGAEVEDEEPETTAETEAEPPEGTGAAEPADGTGA